MAWPPSFVGYSIFPPAGSWCNSRSAGPGLTGGRVTESRADLDPEPPAQAAACVEEDTMPEYRSRTTTAGRNMAGARALCRATGMKDDDFHKPIIAVANSFTQFVPGHELGEGVGHGDDRLVEVIILHAGGQLL